MIVNNYDKIIQNREVVKKKYHGSEYALNLFNRNCDRTHGRAAGAA